MDPILRLSLAKNVVMTLFSCMALIQIFIALGLVPVTIIWGGSQKELTPSLRLASIAAAGILMGFAYIIHKRATTPAPAEWLRRMSWGVTGYMALNTVGNLLSSNMFEKVAFSALTASLVVSCGFVSSSNVSLSGAGDAPYTSVE